MSRAATDAKEGVRTKAAIEPGRWRGVAAEKQDELPDRVSVLLRVRSRRLLGDLLRPHRRASPC